MVLGNASLLALADAQLHTPWRLPQNPLQNHFKIRPAGITGQLTFLLFPKSLFSTYGHNQLKIRYPVRAAIHKQLNGSPCCRTFCFCLFLSCFLRLIILSRAFVSSMGFAQAIAMATLKTRSSR
ncbi:hypothetical protein KCU78_g9011, partial [Aureobasidium melanogenum]